MERRKEGEKDELAKTEEEKERKRMVMGGKKEKKKKKKKKKKLNEQKLIQIDVSDYPLGTSVPEISLSTRLSKD